MPAKERSATEILIDRALARQKEIAELEKLQAADVAEILKLGAGKHSASEEGVQLQVVGASLGSSGKTSYELADDDEKRARELAGEKFLTLFDRKVVYSPIQGFADVVPTHLTPAKSRDLLELCRRTSRGSIGRSAYIIWPK